MIHKCYIPFCGLLVSPPMPGVEDDNIGVFVPRRRSLDDVEPKSLLLRAIAYRHLPFLDKKWRSEELHRAIEILK